MHEAQFHLAPLTPDHFETYMEIGSESYKQHYLHLWQNQDPTPYLQSSFSREVVQQEWEDPSVVLYLVVSGQSPAGIVKLILDKNIPLLQGKACLFLERIYLLREFSGRGLGSQVLNYVEELGRQGKKEAICLETMQKGRALSFYQKYGFSIIGEKQLDYPDVVDSERPMYILCKNLS